MILDLLKYLLFNLFNAKIKAHLRKATCWETRYF